MDEKFEAWLDVYDAMYAALPAQGNATCPNCGRTTLHLVFTGDPVRRLGWAQLWCESCGLGIHVSRTAIPEGAPMNDRTTPVAERPHHVPNYTLVVP